MLDRLFGEGGFFGAGAWWSSKDGIGNNKSF